MTRYVVNLHVHAAYDYEIDADTREEAIEKAKERHACDTAAENENHMYDFNWLECDAYPEKIETPEYKSGLLHGRK